jgi:hypothetical protein
LTCEALQASNDGFELSAYLVDTSEGCDGALFGSSGTGIAKRLDELDVVIGAAASEFNEHAITVSQMFRRKIQIN